MAGLEAEAVSAAVVPMDAGAVRADLVLQVAGAAPGALAALGIERSNRRSPGGDVRSGF
jgi:hypothetical protein